MLLGQIQEKRGYLRKAIAHWQVAHDTNPFDIRIQQALVSLYEKTSDKAGIIRHKKFLNILQTGGASTFTR
jgi:hypothetical protein